MTYKVPPRRFVNYSPGNLGDVLKHSWLIETARILLYHCKGEFVYVDPFCGAPAYPVGGDPDGWPSWRDKMVCSPLARLQARFGDRDEYAGSTLLIRLVCEEAGKLAKLLVFDRNLQAKELFSDMCGVSWLPVSSGYDVLQAESTRSAHLMLLDPYDFLPASNWKRFLPDLVETAGRVPVLIFLYNKECYADNYGRFRDALRARTGASSVGACVGRLRGAGAWYEMLLLFKEAHEAAAALVSALQGLTIQVGKAAKAEAKFD